MTSSEPDYALKQQHRTSWLSPKIIISGAHFMLFNDTYDAQIDLLELARHLWGAEITTREALATENTGVKSILMPAPSGTGKDEKNRTTTKGGRAKKNIEDQLLGSKQKLNGDLTLSASFGSTNVSDGMLLRVRFPRTIAFREREVTDKSSDEDDREADGERGGKGRGTKIKTRDEPVEGKEIIDLSYEEELPMLSVLSTLHHHDGGDEYGKKEVDDITATPILGSTLLGGADVAAVGGLGNAARPAADFTMFQSSLFGMSDQRNTRKDGNSSGFSELYRSLLPSTAHSGEADSATRLSSDKQLNAEANIEDLIAASEVRHQHDAQTFNGKEVAANRIQGTGNSLFDLNAQFSVTPSHAVPKHPYQSSAEANENQLLTTADVLADRAHRGVEERRSKRTIVEKITFESIFCTISKKGSVSVMGSIPAHELPAISQMVHEYLARAILQSCPWCVTLSATASLQRSLAPSSREELPSISTKEMLASSSGNAWREYAATRFRAQCAETQRRQKAEEEAKEAKILEAIADDDGFALPFAPAPKKPHTESSPSAIINTVLNQSQPQGTPNVLAIRLNRLRSLLSFSQRNDDDAATDIPAYCGQQKPLEGSRSAADLEYVSTENLSHYHSFRVANIMCHLLWNKAATDALQHLRNAAGVNNGGKKDSHAKAGKHLLVGEFETFVNNVTNWSQTKQNSFKSTSTTATDTGEVIVWRPLGVVIVLSSTQDYVRFEWHFKGRVTEIIAQRRSATFRIVVATDADDCRYVSDVLIPVCMGFQ